MSVEMLCSDPVVYRVQVPFLNLSRDVTNVYIIRSGSDTLLVDVGASEPGSAGIIRHALDESGCDHSKLSVFLTHAHFDHAAQLAEVVTPDIPVYLSPVAFESREPGRAEYETNLFCRCMRSMGAMPSDSARYGELNAETVRFDPGSFDYRFIDEGGIVSVGSLEFHCLSTPGHSPDHLCLIEVESGLAFVGDSVLAGTTPAVDISSYDMNPLRTYFGTLGKLDRTPCRMALPGHGDPFFDRDSFRASIKRIACKKRGKIDKAMKVVESAWGHSGRPVCGMDVALGLAHCSTIEEWAGKPEMYRYYILKEVFCCLSYLASCGSLMQVPCATDGVLGFCPLPISDNPLSR